MLDSVDQRRPEPGARDSEREREKSGEGEREKGEKGGGCCPVWRPPPPNAALGRPEDPPFPHPETGSSLLGRNISQS
jgi:hypothetical protein